MPAFAAAIAVALALVSKFIIAKILLAFGLQLGLVVGLDQLMDWALQQAYTHLNLLDPQIYTILKLTRIPDALSIISAAALVKYSFVYGAGKLIWLTR